MHDEPLPTAELVPGGAGAPEEAAEGPREGSKDREDDSFGGSVPRVPAASVHGDATALDVAREVAASLRAQVERLGESGRHAFAAEEGGVRLAPEASAQLLAGLLEFAVQVCSR